MFYLIDSLCLTSLFQVMYFIKNILYFKIILKLFIKILFKYEKKNNINMLLQFIQNTNF